MDYQTITYVNNKEFSGIYSVKVKNNNEMPDFDIIYGRNIEDKNEVLLDINGVNLYLEAMGIQREYDITDLIEGNISTEDLELIFNNEIYLSATIECTRLSNAKVVGIYYQNIDENADTTIVIDNRLVDELSHPIYNSLDIYVESVKDSDMGNIYDLIEQYGYRYTSVTGKLGVTIFAKLSMMLGLLLAIMVCVILVTMIMIHYATKVILNDRIYEVGVLKALGATNTFVLKLFLLQNVVIGIVSSVTAILVIIGIINLKLIKYEGIPLLMAGIVPCLIAIIIGILIAVLSGLYEICKISRKSVVECIRNKS